MKLTIAFSPCPNDTFIFDALIHEKIDTEGLIFDVIIADVEQLNRWAFNGKFDITKLSFGAFTNCVDKYALLDSGAAIGRNCGPILIRKPNKKLDSESKIAIPGKFTTANMILSIAFPELSNKEEFLFSDIENKVLNDEVDAGLIIHENRFTYKDKGLEKEKDLGEFWEEKTSLPIPLGGIVIKRGISFEIQKKFERLLRRSVEFAFKNRDSSSDYVKSLAHVMKKEVMDAHIRLYVNNFSISLGKEGREAVEKVFNHSFLKCDNIFV